MQRFAPPGTDSQEVGIVAGHSHVTRIAVHGSAHQLLQVPVPTRNWTSIPMQLDDNKVQFNKHSYANTCILKAMLSAVVSSTS